MRSPLKEGLGSGMLFMGLSSVPMSLQTNTTAAAAKNPH